MSILIELMVKVGLLQRRQDGRRSTDDLEILYGPEKVRRKMQVRDISATGVFVLTRERLEIGTHRMINLRHKKATNTYAFPGVHLPARVVRQDDNGAGLTFAMSNRDARQWLKLMAVAASLAAADDIVGRFRIAKAISFLARACAPVAGEFARLMYTSMPSQRRDQLATIVNAAEEYLGHWKVCARNKVPSGVIYHVIVLASSAEGMLCQSLWSQLLATSWLTTSNDQQTLKFAEILWKLQQIDLEIFTAACHMTQAQNTAEEVYCSATELCKIAKFSNLAIAEQHLNHLSDIGLLRRTIRPPECEKIERANMTVTSLGMEFYSRCCASSKRVAINYTESGKDCG